MVSARQQERDRKYRAHKRKLKKQRSKLPTRLLSNPASPKQADESAPMEIEEVDFEQYVQSQDVDASFLAAFKRFNPSEDGAVQADDTSKTQEPEKKGPELSHKKMKKLLRPTVFELKRMTRRPDVVEWVDTTAQDPEFLVYLKSYKNSVSVPKHWSQKRKFMNLRRGSDRMPFTLPDFIEATGIAKIRAQMREREAGKLLKQRMRERMNPKLGKLDIDYQVLHDAFFKYQTKPKMTAFGDVYHEGKENELKMRVYRPGQLSDELKRALGMPDYCPPPWLINMQRFGPPPSYPNLKIPGLNSPLPDYAALSREGKGGLNYGDPFNSMKNRLTGMDEDYGRKHWGDIEPESEEEEEEVVEETANFVKNTSILGFADLTPLMADLMPSITTSKDLGGYETPNPVNVRKKFN